LNIQYQDISFQRKSLELIDKINEIIEIYAEQGYVLTLRQVYYQLVARDIIPNNERSYKNIGNVVRNGRRAGLISWTAIEDRTRYLRGNSHWDSPSEIIKSAVNSYKIDKWAKQEYYLEVWVEKDALIEIVGQACRRLDLSYFSCRGYTSDSEMWNAARRIINKTGDNDETGMSIVKTAVILHLGDHDPSGIDMSRDIEERLAMFGAAVDFRRIALTKDQIDRYSPPPNPAKLTDTRAGSYISKYGAESWELDALEPQVIDDLITDWVTIYRDDDIWDEAVSKEEDERDQIARFLSTFNE